VAVTATKIDPTQRAGFGLEISPGAVCGCLQCRTVLDPVLAQLRIPADRHRLRESFDGLAESERYVTIQNGRPGARRVHVVVNGHLVVTRWLRDGTVRRIDAATAMLPGGANQVTLIVDGAPGASLLVSVADVPPDGAEGEEGSPRILWRPGEAAEGMDLHWGR
jgi:hypothetical protein